MIVQTASEALARYQDFLARDALVQKSWHTEKDGRQLACALGVLGDNLKGVRDCPAQVMPRWLAQHVVWFFDGQAIDDAKDWGARFYAELARVNGNVPFSVVHMARKQANFVCPLAIEIAEKRTRDTAPHAAAQELHKRALAGDLAGKEEWVAKLRLAYAYAAAYADAYANLRRRRRATPTPTPRRQRLRLRRRRRRRLRQRLRQRLRLRHPASR